MPDFTIEYFWECSSVDYIKHNQFGDPVDGGECAWLQFIDGDEPLQDPEDPEVYYCPKCGREARPRGWAV